MAPLQAGLSFNPPVPSLQLQVDFRGGRAAPSSIPPKPFATGSPTGKDIDQQQQQQPEQQGLQQQQLDPKQQQQQQQQGQQQHTDEQPPQPFPLQPPQV